MKKKFNLRAKVIGLAFLAAGVSAAVPAALPQAVMAEEPAASGSTQQIVIPYGASYNTESKTVTRTVHYMYKYEDGSTEPIPSTDPDKDLAYSASVGMTKITVYNKKTGAVINTYYSDPVEFPAWQSPELPGYSPDKAMVPARTFSWDDESEDIYVYYTRDKSNESIEYHDFTRNIHTIYKDSDGKTIKEDVRPHTVQIARYVWTKNNGEKIYGDWGNTTVEKMAVQPLEGYRADKTEIPAVILSSPNDKFEDVYITYTKRPTRTETKKITRKINLIGNNADGTTSDLGSATYGVTLTREVYTDTNGSVEVKRDWDTGKYPEYSVPDRDGYTKQQDTVPELQVTKDSKDSVVNVYYNQKYYTVRYHLDNTSSASDKNTKVVYGRLTNTLTLSQLGFSKADHSFQGWRVYRDYDDTWYLKDSSGKKSFKKLVNGQLPSGYTFVLYKNGEAVKQTAPGGEVHLYAQWAQRQFVVNYYLDDNSAASSKKTTVNYGTLTNTLSLSELGFSKADQVFKGWKAYREIDDSWYMRDSNGVKSFKKLVNGKLPAGHSFVLYKNGEAVKATATGGAVHFYAQWEQKRFTVKYHLDDSSAASSKSTIVDYGTLTDTCSIEELGFAKSGKTFAGWKAYREIDDSWYMRDSNGVKAYKKLENGKLPAGHSFVLYKNKEAVKYTASSGVVHFYAQWK